MGSLFKSHGHPMRVLLLSIGIVVLIAAAVSFWAQPDDQEQVFCTQEAMQCPDGSYVGRTGPKCEFAPCPRDI